MIILGILAFIVGLGLIILVHELGHFYCAKKAGILCHEFSIGFGPVLWQKKSGETKISIRALPIGGYVAMADSALEEIFINPGQEVGINIVDGIVSEIFVNKDSTCDFRGIVTEIDLLGLNGNELSITLDIEGELKYFPISQEAFIIASEKDKMQITPYHRTFDSKKVRHRAITMSAGVIMNFILAIFLYIIISFAQGVPNVSSAVLGEVSDSSPASLIGLKEKDELKYLITNEGQRNFSSWTEFSSEMDKLSHKGITTFTIGFKDHETGEELQKEVNALFTAQNIGLSNSNITSDVKYDKGVQVGNLALKYGTSASNKTDAPKSGPTLTNGDYILRMSVVPQYKKSDAQYPMIEVNSWEDIISLMNNVDAVKDKDLFSVTFEYYDHETGAIVGSSDPIYSYSDALLDSQQIVKYKTYIGVSPTTKIDFFGCLGNAFKSFWSSATIVFRTLKELIAPTASVREVGLSDLSSVVGIFDIFLNVVKSGSILPFLSLVALLSVNIGIMNLLPIPGLDGGKLVMLAYEGVTHKKPNKKFEAIMTNIVFILLLLLFIFVTYNDIVRLFK